MAIDAWHDGYYGDWKYIDRGYTSKRTTSRGSVTTSYGSTNHTSAFANRRYPSNNPFTLVKGFPWRDQSSYERIVMQESSTPANYYRILETGSRYDYTGYPQSSASARSYLCTYPVKSDYSCDSVHEVDKAVTECLLKLKAKKVDIGVALAESVRTVNMVAKAATQLWEPLVDIKRGRFKLSKYLGRGLEKPSLSAANRILEIKYGWIPLMKDLHGSYEILQKGLFDKRAKLFSAERHITREYTSSSSVSYWDNRVQHAKVQGSCKIWAEVDSKLYAGAASVGLNNPLSLAWELVPYSFVIDWGMPVGNLLEALNAAQGLTFHGGYKSIRMEGTNSGDLKAVGSGTKQRHEYKFLHYKRMELNSFPTPVPYYDNPFSTSNVLTALSLWRQLMK